MPLKVISLFSGCGGSDLGILGGFSYLGHNYISNNTKIVLALDSDFRAVETYNLNFKHKAIVKDIKEVTDKDLVKGDLVIGGFPCQSFSTVNPTKDPFDERGMLYKEMGKIITKTKPKVFIVENVKGMARLHKGKILNSIISEYESYGYKTNWTILNAADYGVPQKRERVFIVGIRNDFKKKFEFPSPTHDQNGKGLPKWIGINKILQDKKNIDKKYYFSEKAVLGMKNAKKNMKRGLAQNLNEPSLTITSHLAKASLNSRDPVILQDKVKEIYRRYTPLEAARIQSFPDTFIFAGSELSAYRQIGNAIAPVMMWHITNKICKYFSED